MREKVKKNAIKVPSWADQAKFEEIISNLLVKKSARAVVLFTRADDAR